MATYYWVGGDGTWDNSNTANWSAASGGAGGSGPPAVGDTVYFDANSGSGTCTTAATAAALDLVLDSATLVLSLGDNLTIASRFFLTSGTINLNDFTFTMGIFISTNTNVRNLSFGSGSIDLTGSNASIWSLNNATNLNVDGSQLVNLIYSGSVGTRAISSYTASEATAFSFAVLAGTDTVTINGRARNIDLTNFSGSYNGASSVTAYGDVVFGPSTTILPGAGALFFGATSGTQNITTNGNVLDFTVNKFGAVASLVLQDDFQMGASRTLTLTAGTLDANDYDVSIGSFALGGGTKTLTIGSGTWTIEGSGTAWNALSGGANLTVSPSSGVISMTSASAKTFAGGGKAYPTLNQGGAGALTIQQSNTFANITNTVQPSTITLTSGTTQAVDAFGVSGTAGNLITLNASTPGSQATLSDSNGTNSISFVSIQDIEAIGGATWDAFVSNGNVDAGNNLGWDFRAMMRKMFISIFRPIFRPVF